MCLPATAPRAGSMASRVVHVAVAAKGLASRWLHLPSTGPIRRRNATARLTFLRDCPHAAAMGIRVGADTACPQRRIGSTLSRVSLLRC